VRERGIPGERKRESRWEREIQEERERGCLRREKQGRGLLPLHQQREREGACPPLSSRTGGFPPPGRHSRRPPAMRRRRSRAGVATGHPTRELGRGNSPSLQQSHGLAPPGRGLAWPGFGHGQVPRAAPCAAGEGGGARPPQGEGEGEGKERKRKERRERKRKGKRKEKERKMKKKRGEEEEFAGVKGSPAWSSESR